MLTKLQRSVGCLTPEGDPDGYHHYHRRRNFGRNLDLTCHRRDVEDPLKQDQAHSQFFMALYLRSCHSRLIFSGGRYDPGKHGNNHYSAFGCLYPRTNLRGFNFAPACDLAICGETTFTKCSTQERFLAHFWA